MKSDCVIVGAGPAGIACSIQLMRYGIKPILFEKEAVGGLIRNANCVENYPGFPQGIRGTELADLLNNHLKYCNIEPLYENVKKCEWVDNRFVITSDIQEIIAKVLVIASGTMPFKNLGFQISDLIKEKIYYEVYPILNVRGKKIAVIGSGDAAFDYALNLSQKNDILLLNRNETVKCLPLLWEQIKNSEHITYHSSVQLENITRKADMLILSIRNKNQPSFYEMTVDCIVPAIGREPCLNFLSKNLIVNQENLEKTGRLHFIGDVRNGLFRQIAISNGDGVKAAMQINMTLMKDCE